MRKRRRLTDAEARLRRAIEWYGRKLDGERAEDIAAIYLVTRQHINRQIRTIPEAVKLLVRRGRQARPGRA